MGADTIVARPTMSQRTNIRLQGPQGTAVMFNKVDLAGTVTERLKAHTTGASEEVYEDSILHQPAQHIKQRLPHQPARRTDRPSCHGVQRTPVGVATTDTHSAPP